MNELDLPPAPPLPAEVRERALQTVLAGLDAPPRQRRPFLLAAAAAAVVVTLLVTTTFALSGFGPGERPPPRVASIPHGIVGWPLSDGSDKSFVDRCGNAVEHSDQSQFYGPPDEWKVTSAVGTGALETDVIIDDFFACLLTPGATIFSENIASASAGTPIPGNVSVTRMAPGKLVFLNPDDRRLIVGPRSNPDKASEIKDANVAFYDINDDEAPEMIQVQVIDRRTGETLYDGPLPEPEDATRYVDRELPKRTGSPDDAVLDACIAKAPTHVFSDPGSWVPFGRHEIEGAPPLLIARVGDVGVGFCELDPPATDLPDYYRAFDGFPLPPLDDPTRAKMVRWAHPTGPDPFAIIRIPPKVVRAEMLATPENGEPRTVECSVLDDLAVCSMDRPPESDNVYRYTYTTYESMDPQSPGLSVE
ncbi:hypothetical protein [Pseudonocardia sp. TRM90224]|uniref:hypothetical protein n=1 Tax=Pseudonocardia sp. TRM90224 TaxID=2812678 RepID=UPI001E3B375C|nr:hypothetical protein [Pseudonocardia sp. TRM90224]